MKNHDSTPMCNSKSLHVIHLASGDLWAGAEVQLFTLCLALAKIDNTYPSVVLLNHGVLENKLKENHIPVKVLDESLLNGLQIGWQLFLHFRKYKPGIVHTHRLKENILGSLAAWLARISSLRTVHGAPEHCPSWFALHKRLFYIMDALVGRYIQSSIVAVSSDLQNHLLSYFPQKKLTIIENGLNIELLRSYQRKLPIGKADNQKKYKIGLVGRLVEVKRVDLFIQTALHLNKMYPEFLIKYHIYGDGPLRSKMEQLCKTYQVEGNVTLEGHCDTVYTQIASLDALVIPSDHEGLPMTLLESMSIGTPIVAHAVGGIVNVCNNNECCWLFEDNSIESIAETLIKCITNREEKTKYARDRVNKLYSSTNNANSYHSLYLGVTQNLVLPHKSS